MQNLLRGKSEKFFQVTEVWSSISAYLRKQLGTFSSSSHVSEWPYLHNYQGGGGHQGGGGQSVLSSICPCGIIPA